MSEIRYEKPSDPRFNDITGKRFGRLVVGSFSFSKKNKWNKFIHYWNCFCDCGNSKVIAGKSLKTKNTKSCGCLEKHVTHGLTNHPLYERCRTIIKRCYKKTDDSYRWYGQRGIYVQESWLNNLGLMIREIEAEIGLPPFDGAQIDRIENHLGYESGNIQWLTTEENCRKRRDSHNQARRPIYKNHTPTYNSWCRIITLFKDEVCDEWICDRDPDTDNGFKNFYKDMGERPTDRYFAPLVRIDETKPFKKGNVVWGYGQGKRMRIKP